MGGGWGGGGQCEVRAGWQTGGGGGSRGGGQGGLAHLPSRQGVVSLTTAPMDNKADSRPRHLQGKGAHFRPVKQAWGFSLFIPM